MGFFALLMCYQSASIAAILFGLAALGGATLAAHCTDMFEVAATITEPANNPNCFLIILILQVFFRYP